MSTAIDQEQVAPNQSLYISNLNDKISQAGMIFRLVLAALATHVVCSYG